MRKLFVGILSVCFMLCGFVLSAQDLSAPINPDPNVKIGKLENGMTYYLRANKKPENRIEFQLAVNAGSMQENEDQLGLAHFTEHMGFNGIPGYPGNELVSELQNIGVSFGGDLNAYTSFDETIYMVQMPADDQKYIDMGLNILYGWACGMLMDNQEIDDERGVITEEYRMGLGASDRMRKEWFPVVFANSRYADRLPIGTLEVIQGFKHQTIKDFYNDWYRPDLQAVIIVGDFDMEQMEKAVKDKFGKIPAKKECRQKISYPVPPHKEPQAVVCTDKEAMGTQVMLVRTFPHFAMKTQGDYRTHLMHELYYMMYDSRYSEMLQDPKTPFVGASTGYGELVGNVDAYMSSASSKDGKVKESLEALMREDYRVLQHGFLDTELARAKEELLSLLEKSSKEVDKTESGNFAAEYVNHYLKGDPIPGAKREYNLAKRMMESITVAEVNALAKQWIVSDNIAAVVLMPEKEGVVIPTKEEILDIVKNRSLLNVEPYVDTYKEQEIVEADLLKPGKVTSTKEYSSINTKEITLSNGITVFLKKTDFKNDEIIFNARSKGGISLYQEQDVLSALFAGEFVTRAGISEMNYTSLEKKLKGKVLELSPYISTIEEGFSGSMSPKDADLFFQYLHALFTSPREDANAYELVINETVEQLAMIKAMPMYRFLGSFMDEIAQNSPYAANVLTMKEEDVRKANYQRGVEIYKERFANPADFIYTFVGNFDEATFIPMIEKYLGSLKTTATKENFRAEVLPEFPKNKLEQNVYAGVEEQSWVGIAYEKEYPWSNKNNMILSQISQALQIELIETIREKMSGVYSPMLMMNYEKYPVNAYNIMVMFSCSPDNTDKLSKAVFDILKDFQKKGPKAETLKKVKEQMIRQYEKSQKENSYWLSLIAGRTFNGEPLETTEKYEDRVKNITAKEITKFMNQYFDAEHYVKMYLYPEKK
ncbi:insulinase family protein [Bacteroidales bacterium OttesenSCG-928-C03]|nr:insulinase family protein [Bacteroidales bacterium OttesenSCG-928-E04]MDL2308034.1 insulinase family protein [Bacteroidales bacterium OttesenSCG-928-C03]MDL2325488.1 insulinase family protein [Bacteroidales bacterium OttesenSCG-928-A14]